MEQHNNNCSMTIRQKWNVSVSPTSPRSSWEPGQTFCAGSLQERLYRSPKQRESHRWVRQAKWCKSMQSMLGVVIYWNILRLVNKSIHDWSWSLRPFRSCRMVQHLNGSCQGCQLHSVKGHPCHPALGLTANAGGSHLISVTAPRCLLCKVDAAQ